MQSRQTPPIEKLIQENCQNLKNHLFPKKVSRAMTELYRDERWKAEHGLEGRFIEACRAEDIYIRGAEKHMPNGARYLDDATLQILSPSETAQETTETVKGSDNVEEEVDATDEHLADLIMQEYLRNTSDSEEEVRDSLSPLETHLNVGERLEQLKNDSKGDVSWATLYSQLTPVDKKILMVMLHVSITVSCFGWLRFIWGTSVVLLITWGVAWSMGVKPNWDIFDLKHAVETYRERGSSFIQSPDNGNNTELTF
jgi:hypothetical protein